MPGIDGGKRGSFSGASAAYYQHVTGDLTFLQYTPHAEIVGVVSVDLSPFLLQQIRSAAGLNHIVGDIGGSGSLFLEGSRDIHGVVALQEAGVSLVEIRLFDEFVAVLPARIRGGEERWTLTMIDGMTYETETHNKLRLFLTDGFVADYRHGGRHVQGIEFAQHRYQQMTVGLLPPERRKSGGLGAEHHGCRPSEIDIVVW